MAAVALGIQTLAGLLEVGDQVKTGPAPDDFVTVVCRWDRPQYVKLEVEMFDHSTTITRIRHSDVVVLAPSFEIIAEEEEVTAE